MLGAFQSLLGPAADVLDVATNFTVVPGLPIAASLLRNIQQNCDNVVAHKEECQALSRSASQFGLVLEEKANDIQNPSIREVLDEVELTLDSINKKTTKWAQYGRVTAYFKDSKIASGLGQCRVELDLAQKKLMTSTQLSMAHTQDEILAVCNASANTATESLNLLMQLVGNLQDVSTIASLERNGHQITQQVMDKACTQLAALKIEQEQIKLRNESDNSDPVSVEEAEFTERLLHRYQTGLSKLFQMTGVSPSTKILDGQVVRRGEIPKLGGVYTDIYEGYWLEDTKVALKAIRGVRAESLKAKNRFEQEILVWSQLGQHKNILKFLGVVTNIGHYLQLVSPWQTRGNIKDFTRDHEEHSDRLHLMFGASEGLSYLHERGIVHGNVKCNNILVSSEGEALICDFGMSKVVEDVTEQHASSTLTRNGSSRWLAPELIEGEITSPTFSCDSFAFGMTLLEIITLQWPWMNLKREAQVIHRLIYMKERPERPTGPAAERWLSDRLWELMGKCWLENPAGRPSMLMIKDCLKECYHMSTSAATVPTGLEQTLQSELQ